MDASQEKDARYTTRFLEDVVSALAFLGYGLYAYLSAVLVGDLFPSLKAAKIVYLILAWLLIIMCATRANVTRMRAKRTGNKEYQDKLKKSIALLKKKLDPPVDNSTKSQ